CNGLDLVLPIVQPWHDRGHHDSADDALCRKHLESFEPLARRERSWLDLVRERLVDGGDREVDMHARPAGDLANEIEIACDQRRFRDHTERLVVFLEDLETGPSEPKALLGGLIRIGGCSN